MYSVERRIGRLIEIRFWSSVGAEEAISFRRDHEAILLSTLGNYVSFVDMSEAIVFSPEMVDALVAALRSEVRLLRSALVLGSSPTLSLQMQRVLRDAPSPHRRTFREAREAEMFLAEVLSTAERARLREIADRRTSDPGPSSAPQGPASVGAPPQSTTFPSSLRSPTSARNPVTTKIPAVGRSPNSGGQGNT